MFCDREGYFFIFSRLLIDFRITSASCGDGNRLPGSRAAILSCNSTICEQRLSAIVAGACHAARRSLSHANWCTHVKTVRSLTPVICAISFCVLPPAKYSCRACCFLSILFFFSGVYLTEPMFYGFLLFWGRKVRTGY